MSLIPSPTSTPSASLSQVPRALAGEIIIHTENNAVLDVRHNPRGRKTGL